MGDERQIRHDQVVILSLNHSHGCARQALRRFTGHAHIEHRRQCDILNHQISSNLETNWLSGDSAAAKTDDLCGCESHKFVLICV
jgi:hypothetical protein